MRQYLLLSCRLSIPSSISDDDGGGGNDDDGDEGDSHGEDRKVSSLEKKIKRTEKGTW